MQIWQKNAIQKSDELKYLKKKNSLLKLKIQVGFIALKKNINLFSLNLDMS